MQLTQTSPSRFRQIAVALAVVLAVLMALNTKFLTPAEVAQIAPKPFDPTQTAAELWGKAQSDLPGQAAPLGEVVTAFQKDVKGAAAQYKAVSPNENSFDFPVTLSATVLEASPTALKVQVPGVPAQTPVTIPLTTGLNGTVIRDAMGFKFAQAPGQTDFQYVGDEIKKLQTAEIGKLGDVTALQGKQVDITGVVSVLATGNTVPLPKPVTVQPVKVGGA